MTILKDTITRQERREFIKKFLADDDNLEAIQNENHAEVRDYILIDFNLAFGGIGPASKLADSLLVDVMARDIKTIVMQDELSELLEQFDATMTSFKSLADKSMADLEQVSAEAIKRIDETCKRAIQEIQRIWIDPIDYEHGSDKIAREFFELGATEERKTIPDPSFSEWHVPITVTVGSGSSSSSGKGLPFSSNG